MTRTRLLVAAALLLAAPAVLLLVADDVPAQDAGSDAFELAEWPMGDAAARGRVVYEKYCIGCHGEDGRGDGKAAELLNPLPRDFQKGRFKFRTTPSGEMPTEDDLVKTITCGLAGSAMPGFPLVSEADRRDVAQYVLHLAAFGRAAAEVRYLVEEEALSLAEVRAEHMADIREGVAAKMARAKPIAVPAPPEATDELVRHGAKLFAAQCAACHGATGRGDGASSYTLRDWKGGEIRARDFTSGVFRAGSTSEDLYVRMRTGLLGTPMPAFKGSEDDIWGLVFFVKSLRDPASKAPYLPHGCGATESAE